MPLVIGQPVMSSRQKLWRGKIHLVELMHRPHRTTTPALNISPLNKHWGYSQEKVDLHPQNGASCPLDY